MRAKNEMPWARAKNWTARANKRQKRMEKRAQTRLNARSDAVQRERERNPARATQRQTVPCEKKQRAMQNPARLQQQKKCAGQVSNSHISNISARALLC